MTIPFWKSPPKKYNTPRKVVINYTGARSDDEILRYPSNFITTSKLHHNYTF